MENNTLKSMVWTYKELLQLLIFVLIIVPIGVEYFLQNYLKELLGNTLYSGTLTGLIMAIMFTLAVYLISLRPHHISWDSVGLRSFSRTYWKWIVFWTVVLIIASIVILVVLDFMMVGSENSKTESLKSNMTWFNFFIGFISAAVISPVYEEIFYRGFLYKWFMIKLGVKSGIIISSFIFMIVHIPTFNTLPVNFISGVVFAWTYEKSGSILPGIIIHGTFNGIAIILSSIS